MKALKRKPLIIGFAAAVIVTVIIISLITGILFTFFGDKISYSPDKYAHLIADEPRSEDYDVWVNGVKAIVYVARVQDPPWEKERTGKGNYLGTVQICKR